MPRQCSGFEATTFVEFTEMRHRLLKLPWLGFGPGQEFFYSPFALEAHSHDSRISRVRLATMTIPLPSSQCRVDLSAHSHTPTRRRFTAQFDGRVPAP